MTTIALPPTATVPIVCPSWCTVSYEEHVAELGTLEGFVIHWGARSRLAMPATSTYPDGSPDPMAPPEIYLGDIPLGDGLQLADAERIARAILAAVEEARA